MPQSDFNTVHAFNPYPANIYFCQVHVFVCFAALRPKSTAMVMARQPVHPTTLFPGKLAQQLTSTSCTYFRL